MQHDHNSSASSMTDSSLDSLAQTSSQLGFEIVDIAGFLDTIEKKSRDQLHALKTMQQGAIRVVDANSSVLNTIQTVSGSTQKTLETVQESVSLVRESGQHSQSMAEWVQVLNARSTGVEKTVEAMRADNERITSIATQVNILAINAKIEAGRAGQAGLGFAVVAEAINDLSHKTERAAAEINTNILALAKWIQELRVETDTVSKSAKLVLDQARNTDDSLAEIELNAKEINIETDRILSEAMVVKDAVENFTPSIRKVGKSVEETSSGIHQTHGRVENLITSSERLVQGTVALGGQSADGRFIAYASSIAEKISDIFQRAIETGQISSQDLFDRRYQPIPDTDPQQVMARFTRLTDRLLSPLFEAALDFDKRVAFCAAVDVNGYLPTHNSKFSQPQGNDPVWNTANCRNRRIFDDRVGLKAGRNSQPFLMQVYRRDMGGGRFVMMKDLSTPILVNNRQWGGLRLGFSG